MTHHKEISLQKKQKRIHLYLFIYSLIWLFNLLQLAPKEVKSMILKENKLTEKFDVLRGRLLGSQNNFHRQLGGQIKHQPCSRKAAQVVDAQSWTALFRAFSSHRQPSASKQRCPAEIKLSSWRQCHFIDLPK